MRLFHTIDHHTRWEQFLRRYPLKRFAAGEVILLANEEPKTAFLIQSGLVKTYNITDDGSERPVTFDTAGEIFPIGWVFGQIDVTSYFYQAFTDCAVRLIPRPDLLEHLRQNPKMGSEMYASLAARFVSLQARVYALAQPKAADKIIHTLLYLGERFGTPKTRQTAKLTIPLTQQELANFIGLTRETTSSELKKLERSGVIRYTHKEYTVNTAKLTHMSSLS